MFEFEYKQKQKNETHLNIYIGAPYILFNDIPI